MAPLRQCASILRGQTLLRKAQTATSLPKPSRIQSLTTSQFLRQQQNQAPPSVHEPAQQQQGTSSPRSNPSPHANFYKEFGKPVFKCFLIAVATYQVLYWSWMKLESLEVKQDKTEELRNLENEVRSLTTR